MEVTVYTRPGCMQCRATTNLLDRNGVSYELIDISDRPEVVAFLRDELGHKGLPVVIVDDGMDPESWSGFRPDLIKELTK